MRAKLYGKETYVSPEVGYTLRMNYSFTENFELHYHDYYEVFLTVSGNTVQVVNGQKQVLPEHSMVLIRSGDVHTYRKEGDFSFANLTFMADTMEKLCQYYGSSLEKLLTQKTPPTVVLSPEDFARTMEKLHALNTVDIHDAQTLTLKMKLLLTDILALFLDFEVSRQENSVPVWLSALVLALQKPEHIGMTLSDMADYTKKTREHICRSFQKYYGMTVSQFVRERRLTYSANLLLNTNLPILDICYTCGFQSVSWFYRAFQEKYGQSPAAFRKNAGVFVPL